MIFLHVLFFLQDTLSTAYSGKWTAQEDLSHQPSNVLVGLLASHDLAFVVFGVVLIVLTALFIYLFRLDAKLKKIEEQLGIKD
ncbi:hypothetical protein EP331_02405 [bacterium]|nr:MAG: hypothetical protein EP331_02405 [bacterium]